MSNIYSAFYIPSDLSSNFGGKSFKNILTGTTNLVQSYGGKTSITSSVVNSIKNIAEKINLQSTSDFLEKYVIGALSELAGGNKISGSKLCEILINNYAPALNLGALQMGYNSIENYIAAVESREVNFSAFLESFSGGLNALSESILGVNYSAYGKEYPLDVVESCEKFFKINTPEHSYNSGITNYVSGLKNFEILVTAHIKNSTTSIETINSLADIFREVMAKRQQITFRLGREIYESCALAKFTPLVTNIYELKFQAKLIYDVPTNFYSDESYISKTLAGITKGGVKVAK